MANLNRRRQPGAFYPIFSPGAPQKNEPDLVRFWPISLLVRGFQGVPGPKCGFWGQVNFKLPILGNHKLNVYLKTIRDFCGIDKPIFSHVARHTYATRCLNRGIRLEVVAKLLGHSTTRITQHYAKLLKNSIQERLRMLLRNPIKKAHPLSNPLELRYFRNSKIFFLSLCCYQEEKSPGQKVVHL